jgi:2-polyprenyl-3-methyl-5-hydroxy-6-metoxy-1,4-benzoquinol methylase
MKKGDTLQGVSCVLCSNTTHSLVGTHDRNGEPLTTVMCKGCGLIKSHPLPSADVLENYYKNQYRADYKGARTPKRKHIFRYASYALTRLNHLTKAGFTSGRLVDVGSGSGEFVFLAQKAGYDVVGLEPHEGYARYTQNTFGVDIQNATLEKANIPPQSVDIVTLHHVLEHLPDPVASLQNMRTWLKPEGVILVDVPDIEADRHAPSRRFHIAHLYNFNHATLKWTLEKAGFQVLPHVSARGTTLIAKKMEGISPDFQTGPENAQTLWGKLFIHEGITATRLQTRTLRLLQKAARLAKEIMATALAPSPAAIALRVYAQKPPKPQT